jgi:hypothetical protein
MKPFYITKQNKRPRNSGNHLRWLWVVVPVLITGTIAGLMWPAYVYREQPYISFYPAAVVLALYLFAILVRGKRKSFRIRHEPVGYISLRVSDSGLEYEPLSRRRLSLDWKEIESVVFCREEAAFPDFGPYLETKWFIRKHDSQLVEIMDESSNREHLMHAFCECLPDFDATEAWQGLRSEKEGRWLCFTNPGRTAGTT